MNTTSSDSAAAGADSPGRSDLSEPLDALIVGGGPAGTAAAFRAKELGLEALVIDFDDILKRIRDYPKDKPILPTFGGGDLGFPEGGELVRSLRFSPIDKDELHQRWKGFYEEFDIPVEIGLELVEMERRGDVWTAVVYDHDAGERDEIAARSVVLAMGRGVPRRFDIPGNTDGIAYRLDDPAHYVEGPVVVVGGGTSAAEAVIAISQAKATADGEPCEVYWSYRGVKMPRVNKNLADQFFESYVGHGNIRYLPESEPVAVVSAPERSELLSFRVDRKPLPGRPSETVHLEFEKERCIACIGADIPEGLLNDVGIPMVRWGPKNKKTIVASPLLESHQEDVYLIGDLLSQAYLETHDFDAPVDDYRLVKHRGNIRASLRDGVFVAEVLRQRLEGRSRSEVDVVIEEVPADEEERDRRVASMTGVIGEAGEASTGSPADEEPEVGGASLVRITQADVEADEYPLRREGATTLGRRDCDVTFEQDTSLTDSHASISRREDGYYLRDDGSRTGTYLRVRPDHPVEVSAGDLVRLGRQILVVRGDGDGDRVEHYGSDGRKRGSHPLDGTTVFGRTGGPSTPDVVLDEDDRTLSRFHLSLGRKDGALQLQDFNSRNGTYLKVDEARKLEHGDVIRIGGQQLEFREEDELPTKTGSHRVPDRTAADGAPEEPAAPAAAPEEEPAGDPHVTFADQDVAGDIDPSSSLLEWAEENEVVIDFECFHGFCGCDVVRVVEGGEHLNDPEDKERETLERKGLEAGEYRLACMTRVSGPVVVEAED